MIVYRLGGRVRGRYGRGCDADPLNRKKQNILLRLGIVEG